MVVEGLSCAKVGDPINDGSMTDADVASGVLTGPPPPPVSDELASLLGGGGRLSMSENPLSDSVLRAAGRYLGKLDSCVDEPAFE